MSTDKGCLLNPLQNKGTRRSNVWCAMLSSSVYMKHLCELLISKATKQPILPVITKSDSTTDFVFRDSGYFNRKISLFLFSLIIVCFKLPAVLHLSSIQLVRYGGQVRKHIQNICQISKKIQEMKTSWKKVRKDYQDRRHGMERWIRWRQEPSQTAIHGVHFALSPRSATICCNARLRVFSLKARF